MPVLVKAAEKSDIDIYMNGLGTVTPLANVTIRTQITGQLTEIRFQEGQEVNKGDLLAVIDPRPYQLALEQAEGQILQAKAQLARRRATCPLRNPFQTGFDRTPASRHPARVGGPVRGSGQDRPGRHRQRKTQSGLLPCCCTAHRSRRAPSGGRRQLCHPRESNGLVTLTEMKPISVIFTLSEDSYSRVAARLHAGAAIPVEAYDSNQTRKLATGTLAAIDNQADTSTGTFKLRAIFANEDEVLFPNEFVNVRMLLDVDRGVIVIPTSAIEQGQKGTYVYVVSSDETVKARPVALGTTQGERVAVTTGLAAGERVVVDGADRLKDGGRVTEQQAGAPADHTHAARGSGAEWGPGSRHGATDDKGDHTKPARPAANGGS